MAACFCAHAGEWAEGVVGEDVDSAMVCFEVVDVFAEDEGPEVFAEELDDVEGVVEAGAVAGESFHETLTDAIALRLKSQVHRIEMLFLVYLF